MDIGSVRMHERHLHSEPPTAAQIAAAIAVIDAHLDSCPVPADDAAPVVGVAGTILTVAAGLLDLPAYDRQAIDKSVLTVPAIHEMNGGPPAVDVQGPLHPPH